MSEQKHEDTPSRYELHVPMKPALMIATGLILLWLVLMYAETYNMAPPLLPGYPGDAFFPRLVLAFSLIFAVVILVRGLLLPQDAAAAGDEASYFQLHWPEFAWAVVLIVLYTNLLVPAGFEIATFGLMMILLVPRLRVTPGTNWAKAALQAAALTVPTVLILYAGFVLFLNIPLPLKFLPLYIQY